MSFELSSSSIIQHSVLATRIQRPEASTLDIALALAHIVRIYQLGEDSSNIIMKEFFKVKTIDQALEFREQFAAMQTEDIPLTASVGRILAQDIRSDIDLPDFPRSIMDGFAVKGA